MKKIIFILLCFSLIFINISYAEEITKVVYDVEVLDGKVVNIDGSEFFKEGEYDLFKEYLLSSIDKDILEGMEILLNTKPTRDHIMLSNWGLFLSKYIGKDVNDYPNELIEIQVSDNSYIKFKPTKEVKQWLNDEVINLISDRLKLKINETSVYLYNLELESGVSLSNYVWDEENNKYSVIKEIKPLNENELLVYDTGIYYGLMLDSEFTRILKGYNNEISNLKSISIDGKNGAVDVLSYIVYLKNIYSDVDSTTLRDYSIYKNLVCNLETGEIFDTTKGNVPLTDSDFVSYKLNKDDLLVVPISDTVVIVGTKYLECFNIGNHALNTGYTVDFTPYLNGEGNIVKLVNTEIEVDALNFSEDGTILNTKPGNNNPLLIYMKSDYYNYERVLKWIWSDKSIGRLDENQKLEVTEYLESKMLSEGLEQEFKLITKGLIPISKTIKIVILVGVIISILLIVFLVVTIKIKLKEKKRKSEVLFSYDDTNDDNSGGY